MMQAEQHGLTACLLRSTAWMVVEDGVVQSASTEMADVLGDDPIHTNVDALWQLCKITDTRQVVRTLSSKPKTLWVCVHGNTIVCSDIIPPELVPSDTTLRNETETPTDLTIVRLSPYGTIDAVFGHVEGFLQLGTPLMRFIHNDDIPRLCAGLSQASSSAHRHSPSTVSFDVRCMVNEVDERPFRFVVLANGLQQSSGMLCILRPLRQSRCESAIRISPSWQLIQARLWVAVEKGITVVARSLAVVLVLCVHSWHTAKTQLMPLVRIAVTEAKARPELDRLFSWIDWTGVLKTRSLSLSLQSPC